MHKKLLSLWAPVVVMALACSEPGAALSQRDAIGLDKRGLIQLETAPELEEARARRARMSESESGSEPVHRSPQQGPAPESGQEPRLSSSECH